MEALRRWGREGGQGRGKRNGKKRRFQQMVRVLLRQGTPLGDQCLGRASISSPLPLHIQHLAMTYEHTAYATKLTLLTVQQPREARVHML